MKIMKQVNKLAVTTVIATSVVGVSQVTQADEISSPEVMKETEKQQITQSDVTNAEKQLTEANQEVAKQEQVVEHAQKELAQAEATVTNEAERVSQAEKLAKEATPENIKKASEAIEQNNQDVAKAEEKLVTSQKQQENTQAELAKQEKTVQEAQKAVNVKGAVVSEAEKKVAEKQAILDGTGSKEVIEKAEQAQAKVETSKQAVNSATAELEEAKKSDAKRAADLAKAEQTQAQAQSKADKTKAHLDQKSRAVAQKQEELNHSMTTLSQAKENLNSLKSAKINFPKGYIEALKDYFNNPTEANSEKLYQLGKEGMKLAGFEPNGSTYLENFNPPYKATAADKAVVIEDVNHLQADVQEELALFNAALINNLREQLGVSDKLIVNRDMLKLAQKLMDERDDRYGHDSTVLKGVAREYGLAVDGFNMVTENIGHQLPDGKVTLADLKRQSYNNIVMMLFLDRHANWGHALSLGALEKDGFVKMQTFGLSTRKLHDGRIAMHYLGTEDRLIKKYKASIDLSNTLSVDTLSSKIQKAQAHLDSLQATYSNLEQAKLVAQKEKEVAQKEYGVATENLAIATENYNHIKNMTVPVAEKKEKLLQAQNALKVDEEANKKAQEAVKELTADVKVKKAALEEAQAELATKRTELTKAQANLKSEQTKLATKQATLQTAKELVKESEIALSKAKKRLAESKVYLANLKSAPATLRSAQESLAVAKNNLAAKRAVLAKEEAILLTLKDKKAQAQNNYSKLSKAYQEVLEAERLLKLEMEKETIERAGGQAIPIVNELGQVTGYVAENTRMMPIATKENGNTISSKASKGKSVSTEKLPTTGEKISLLGFLSGLSLFGLSFVSRKKVK